MADDNFHRGLQQIRESHERATCVLDRILQNVAGLRTLIVGMFAAVGLAVLVALAWFGS
jgi:hypothetical protein